MSETKPPQAHIGATTLSGQGAAENTAGRCINGIGDPSPLGLFAYGITLGVLSFIHLGTIASTATPFVVAISLPVGGLGMLIAGLWAFRRGSTFGGTALTGYGAFWINYYLLFGIYGAKVPKSEFGHIAAIWLALWGLFTLMLFLASFAIDLAHPFFLSWLVITFALLAIGQWTGNSGMIKAAGVTGLVSVAGALYVAFAQLFEAQYQRKVLPFVG